MSNDARINCKNFIRADRKPITLYLVRSCGVSLVFLSGHVKPGIVWSISDFYKK